MPHYNVENKALPANKYSAKRSIQFLMDNVIIHPSLSFNIIREDGNEPEVFILEIPHMPVELWDPYIRSWLDMRKEYEPDRFEDYERSLSIHLANLYNYNPYINIIKSKSS